MVEKLIDGILYSEFDEIFGPVVRVWLPSELDRDTRDLIASKTMNLFNDDLIYNSTALSFLAFPSFKKKGAVRYLTWSDNKPLGYTNTAAITLLFDQEDESILYKYNKDIEAFFNHLVRKIIKLKESEADYHDISIIIKKFYADIVNLFKNLINQEISSQNDSVAFPKDKIDKEFIYKVVICGDEACGKTSTLVRYTNGNFKRTYIPTIGVNITEKQVVVDNTTAKLILWDIAGQAKFQLMRKFYYEGAQAVILMFDLTRPETFDNIPNWYSDFKKNIKEGSNFIAVLCGNKNDLINERNVSKEDARTLAAKMGIVYFETSALTGDNIDELFSLISKELTTIIVSH